VHWHSLDIGSRFAGLPLRHGSVLSTILGILYVSASVISVFVTDLGVHGAPSGSIWLVLRNFWPRCICWAVLPVQEGQPSSGFLPCWVLQLPRGRTVCGPGLHAADMAFFSPVWLAEVVGISRAPRDSLYFLETDR
jgi:hypothetical protein